MRRGPLTGPVHDPSAGRNARSGGATADELRGARALTRLLDTALRIPGTRIRFGLDPLLGLVPGLGDVAGAAMSGYVVILASRLGAPLPVLLRMLANLGVDTVLGAVPLLGDAFDVAWKANVRNLALLERYLDEPGTTRRASTLVVAGILAGVGLVAAGAVVLTVILFRALLGALG
ncbi:MAG TPA: DUF4112 domain-containing protein [Gemmatimonadaceae bacterium]|nr:DUF4112 domain-containing protein [Gemmatimonadaceae bacterium]